MTSGICRGFFFYEKKIAVYTIVKLPDGSSGYCFTEHVGAAAAVRAGGGLMGDGKNGEHV